MTYAYEDPATLAWSAQQVHTWLRRRRRRLAAEQTVELPTENSTASEMTSGGGRGAAA